MKIRKRIAVIMGDIDHPCQQRILNGLIKQAHALDYDVFVFSMFMNIDEETDYQYGEKQIFKLIRYELFDAVIYAPCSIGKRAIREHFAKDFAEHCSLPIVALEFEHPDYQTVIVDDTAAYEHVVDHLIECHHAADILCLTGFKGNLQAEARLQGYRNSMQNHGLTVREDRVIYGDFWIQAATELAQKLADGTIEMPDAVACVSDFVALTLCNRLIELGVRVPEDVIVVGFDASKEAEENVPSLTSYARPLAGLGIEAVRQVHQQLTGTECDPIEVDHGHIVTADSCGCGEDFAKKFKKRQKEMNSIQNYHTMFNSSHMAESLNSADTLNRCLEKLINYLYLIHDLKDFHLCLCDQWDDFDRNSTNGDDYKHYTDIMRLRISCMDGDARIVDEPYAITQLLPSIHEPSAIPRVLYFTPLHFNERCFGYCAMGYGNQPLAFDSLYHAWTRNLNNALEFVRVRNIFNSMNQRLYMASIRDTLTGIFNRKGFRRYSAELFSKAVGSGKKLLIVAADLDCLKSINDAHGHLEGDNAITVVANALNTCFCNDEICARTGGDEFLAIGCSNYSDETIEGYLNYVQQYLARYNAQSEKPYTVGVSLGFVCRHVTEDDQLQKLIDEADSKMYLNKTERKKQRQ